MDTRTIAELIIKEIKENYVFSSKVFDDNEMRGLLFEFNGIYEQTNLKAYVLDVPSKTKFKFIKRIIGKLIRTHTIKQMEFNYKIMELVKVQQRIILKNLELIEKFTLTNAS